MDLRHCITFIVLLSGGRKKSCKYSYVDSVTTSYNKYINEFIIYKVVKYRKILLIYNIYFIFSPVKI